MINKYQNIDKNSKTIEEKIQTNVCCGPISSITNKIGGLILGLVTVGLGTTQVVLSSTNSEKKDWVNIGFGTGFIVIGICKIANTFLDYCLWRKQDSQVSNLTEMLNVKSGILIEKDDEIKKVIGNQETLEKQVNIISDKNIKLAKNNDDLTELLNKSNKKIEKFNQCCEFDYVQDAIKKAQVEIKNKSNPSSTQTTPKIVNKEVKDKKD